MAVAPLGADRLGAIPTFLKDNPAAFASASRIVPRAEK
jgi:hypothetical protein